MSKTTKIILGVVGAIIVLGIGFSVMGNNGRNAVDENYAKNAKFESGKMDDKSFNSMMQDIDNVTKSVQSKAKSIKGKSASEISKIEDEITEEVTKLEERRQGIEMSDLSVDQQAKVTKKVVDLLAVGQKLDEEKNDK